MQRKRRLAEVGDLADCLKDWLVRHEIKPTWPDRSYSVCRQKDSWLLRTPVWHVKFKRLTDDRESDLRAAELYLQPDDQNEVNDVSDRCVDVVDAGRRLLLQLESDEIIAEPPNELLEPLE